MSRPFFAELRVFGPVFRDTGDSSWLCVRACRAAPTGRGALGSGTGSRGCREITVSPPAYSPEATSLAAATPPLASTRAGRVHEILAVGVRQRAHFRAVRTARYSVVAGRWRGSQRACALARSAGCHPTLPPVPLLFMCVCAGCATRPIVRLWQAPPGSGVERL